MGWAELCRIIISFIASRKSLFVLENRADILLSAINALITLKPPNVSSNWDIISPHCACAVEDCLFSFRLTTPIIQPVRGKIKITKSVICQLTENRVTKQTKRAIGLRISISMELVNEFSTTVTSALIRAMISPLRSSEKKTQRKT